MAKARLFHFAALATLSTGCAWVWGFDSPIEAVDVTDSSLVDVANDASSPPDSSFVDAGSVDADASDAGFVCAQCIPETPPGWQGPFALYEGNSAPPSCPVTYPTPSYDGVDSPDAPPAKCTCACGAPTGVTCSAPDIDFYFDNSCGAPCGIANQPLSTSCATLSTQGCSGGSHYQVTRSIPSGGACAPSATTDVPDASWNDHVRLCAPPSPLDGVGCGTGALCAPSAGLPYDATRCVARTGVQACPSTYPTQHVVYDGNALDTRGCSACTCDARDGGGCPTTVTTYGDSLCFTQPSVITFPTACASAGGVHSAKATVGAFDGGGCAPDGGAPIGAFTATAPTTICCLP